MEEGEAYPSAILIPVFEFGLRERKGSFDKGIQPIPGFTGLIVWREVLQEIGESERQRWLETTHDGGC
jgi:hypothetical protein